jgi:hypothetical protein
MILLRSVSPANLVLLLFTVACDSTQEAARQEPRPGAQKPEDRSFAYPANRRDPE